MRVLEQGRHRARGVQVVRRDRLVVVGVAHHDASQALFKVGDGGGQAEDGHDLGSHGDVEAVLARHAVRLAAQAVHDVAQLAVVHVHHALPRDLAHVDAQLVAVVDVRVQERRQQVVGGSNGMEVAREVQVDIFHGDDLGVPAAGRAALDAEHGAERRLAQRHDHVLALLRQRVGQSHRRSGLALAGRRGVDGRDQNELARRVLLVLEQVVVHLRLVRAVHLQVLLRHARLLGYLADVPRLRRLGNFDVAQHVGPSLFLVGALSCILLVFHPLTTYFPARAIKYQQPGCHPGLNGFPNNCRSRDSILTSLMLYCYHREKRTEESQCPWRR